MEALVTGSFQAHLCMSHACFWLLSMGCTHRAGGPQTHISRALDPRVQPYGVRGHTLTATFISIPNILIFITSQVFTLSFSKRQTLEAREESDGKQEPH